MRLAVLSDIHGNLVALDAVLADLAEQGGADAIWVLGDLCAFCASPAEVIQRIRALPNAKVIQGNTDRYLVTGRRPPMPVKDEAAWATMAEVTLERDQGFAWTVERLSFSDYEYLRDLKTEVAMDVEGFGWVIGFHAVPGNDETVMLPDTPDDVLLDALLEREGRVVLCGHIHKPMDRTLDSGDGGRWRWINVGSVGLPLDGDTRACYALLEFTGGQPAVDIRRVAYPVDEAIARLNARGYPNMAFVEPLLRMAGHHG